MDTITIGFLKHGLLIEHVGLYIDRLVCANIGIRLAREERTITEENTSPWGESDVHHHQNVKTPSSRELFFEYMATGEALAFGGLGQPFFALGNGYCRAGILIETAVFAALAVDMHPFFGVVVRGAWCLPATEATPPCRIAYHNQSHRVNGRLREHIKKSILITAGQTSAAKSFHPCHTAVHLDDSRQSIFGSKLIAFADVRVGAVTLGGVNEIAAPFQGTAVDDSWLSLMGSTPKPVRLTRMPVLLKIE